MAHDLEPDLLLTLAEVAELGAAAQDPWWIFGGAAAALHGAEVDYVQDVDVLMSPQDAKRVLASQGIIDFGDGGTDRFRSGVYGKLNVAPLPIDILAGFDVNRDGSWVPVCFSVPLRVDLPTATVYVPQLEELIALFRLCGRPKDLDRAAKLEALQTGDYDPADLDRVRHLLDPPIKRARHEVGDPEPLPAETPSDVCSRRVDRAGVGVRNTSPWGAYMQTSLSGFKPTWVHIVEVLWVLASIYLGSRLTYWLGSDFFMHAFSIIMVASPVWLSRLIVAVDRRPMVLVGTALAYAVFAFMVAPNFVGYGENLGGVAYGCAIVFAGLLWVRSKRQAA